MYGDIRVFDRHGNFLFVTNDKRVLNHSWYKCGKYATTRINGKKVYAHRFLTNCPKDLVVDHIDRDPSNNRTENLRICSQTENLLNSKVPKDNKSGYKGVYYSKKDKRWIAQYRLNRRTVYLGSFMTPEEAAQARLDAGFQIE